MQMSGIYYFYVKHTFEIQHMMETEIYIVIQGGKDEKIYYHQYFKCHSHFHLFCFRDNFRKYGQGTGRNANNAG